MELRQLRTFLCLAELGSLTRAAEQLHTAQPALSRQIRLLEDEIGLPLFIRHSRGMELTDAGAALFRFASGPLRQLELALQQVRDLEMNAAGHVALGLMPSVADIFAGRLAERVAEELPNVSLRIAEGYAPHLVEWLQRGDLDATLSYGPPQGAGLKVSNLLQEDMLLIGPADSDLSLERSVVSSTLSSVQLVLPSMPSGLRKLVEQAAAAANIPLNVRVEADAYVVLKHLVSVGMGYTVLPMSAVARDLAAKRLRAAPLEPALTRQVILLEARERASSRATRAVLQILRRELAQLICSGDWPAIPLDGLGELLT